MEHDDDIRGAAASELSTLAKRALEQLTDRYTVLSAAEREALMAARIGAIAELARREAAHKAETAAAAATYRISEIERELSMHRAIIGGADSPELAAAETATRKARMAQLEHEIVENSRKLP